MIKKIISFFDKAEDKIRAHLSHHPIIYTLIGGVSIVLFWRGVWHTADMLQERGGFWGWFFFEPTNLVIVIIILLASGLFVSYFIGDTILMSGMRGEKKMADKTEREIREEEKELSEIKDTIKDIEKDIEKIKEAVIPKEENRDSSSS